jgi:hypothetical protein
MGARRAAAAVLTTAVISTGLVVAGPSGALAATCTGDAPPTCTAPTVSSVKASAPTVEVTAGHDARVGLKAVVNDPDGLVMQVRFVVEAGSTKLFASDSTGTGAASARTYEADVTDRGTYGAGQRKVTAIVDLRYGVLIEDWPGVTSPTATYTLQVEPRLTFYRDVAGSSAKRVKFAGYLTGRQDNSGQSVIVQFKAKGKKKFKKKQVVRTTAGDGAFTTKRFKIKKNGKWRAITKPTGAYLGTKSPTVSIKKNMSTRVSPRDRRQDPRERKQSPRDRKRPSPRR